MARGYSNTEIAARFDVSKAGRAASMGHAAGWVRILAMLVEEIVARLRGGPDPDRWAAALDRSAQLVRHLWDPGWSTPVRDWAVHLCALISYSMAVTGGPQPPRQTPGLLLAWWAEQGVDGLAYALVGAGHRIDGTVACAEVEAAALGPAAVWRAGWHTWDHSGLLEEKSCRTPIPARA